jgi:uncharacterized protein YjbI with pentapeptide repeats
LRGADLQGIDLTQADLHRTSLREANLRHSTLIAVNLKNSDLSWVNLMGGDLSGANLREMDLSRANLTATHMSGADLSKSNLSESKLMLSNLSNSTLVETDLRSANLQTTNLDEAILTGAQLWETQRAGWSIKDVICERIYWDKNAEYATGYSSGEFERIYSSQTTIELHYPGGISTFELSTLPALLQHLSLKHDGATIGLKSVEQIGGGAKVTLTLGDASNAVKAKVESEATELVRMQLKLRENEALRLQIENTTLKQLHETTIRMMLTAAAPQTHFHGPVGLATFPSGNATIELHQTFNDNTELIQLIDKLLTRNAELTAPQSAEIESVKTELQKPNPDKSLLTRTLGFLKTLPKEAILKGAGKLGEKAAEADWSNLLHQFGEFIHHLH